jgi:hypothetical protein
MERWGSITAEMRQAGDQFATCILTGSRPVLLLLGSLGVPASSCLVHVLGLGWPLRQWAQQGAWQGRPIDQETAAGVLIAALGILANSDALLLLDAALAAAAQGSTAA